MFELLKVNTVNAIGFISVHTISLPNVATVIVSLSVAFYNVAKAVEIIKKLRRK